MADAGPTNSPTQASTGAWLTMIGLAGLGLGVSGLFMIFALPAVGLVWYGVLLILLGVAQLAELARSFVEGGRTIRAVLALVYVAAGVALIVLPEAVGALTRLVAVLVAAAGAMRIAWSLAWPQSFRSFGILAGLAVLALGLVLLGAPAGLPLWSLGAVVALDLAVYGLSAFVLGRALRPRD